MMTSRLLGLDRRGLSQANSCSRANARALRMKHVHNTFVHGRDVSMSSSRIFDILDYFCKKHLE